jgi:hypothetical protein
VRTPLALDALHPAIVAGHHDAIGLEPTWPAVRLVFAQCCLEHGVDGDQLHGLWNFNLGNHDATDADFGGPVFATGPEREVIRGQTVQRTHTRPSYASAEAGAAGLLARLREGFSDAFYSLSDGNEGTYAACLKAGKYYTSSALDYAAGLRRWAAEFDRRWPSEDWPFVWY